MGISVVKLVFFFPMSFLRTIVIPAKLVLDIDRGAGIQMLSPRNSLRGFFRRHDPLVARPSCPWTEPRHCESAEGGRRNLKKYIAPSPVLGGIIYPRQGRSLWLEGPIPNSRPPFPKTNSVI